MTEHEQPAQPEPAQQGQRPRALSPLTWATVLGSFGHGLGPMVWTALALCFAIGQGADMAARGSRDAPAGLMIGIMIVTLGLGVLLLRRSVSRASNVVRLLRDGTLVWGRVVRTFERENSTFDSNDNHGVTTSTSYHIVVEFADETGTAFTCKERVLPPGLIRHAAQVLVLYDPGNPRLCRLVDQMPAARVDPSGAVVRLLPLGLITWLVCSGLVLATTVFAVRYYLSHAGAA